MFGVGDSGALVQHAKIVVVARRAHPFHFARVEIGSLGADQLAEDLIAIEGANGEPVRFRRSENMIGGDQTAGTRHVIDDDRGVARDVLAHVARHRARERIEAAAGREADDDADDVDRGRNRR